MKNCSQATLSILAGGQYLKIEFWQITLPVPYAGGSAPIYRFTSGEQALRVGGNLYNGGLIFVRDQITQKLGTAVGSLDMTIEPQFDYPGGQPLIAGGTFLSQLRAGVFDNATWLMSKGFFLPSGSNAVTANGYTYTPPAAGTQLDTSPGLVPWWAGITSKVMAGRFSADITLDESTAILANQQMPRNMIQAGCVHQLGDAGCTVPMAHNTYTGALTVAPTNTAPYLFTANLASATYANNYFNLGIITFTSGVLNGASFTVSMSVASGSNTALTTIMPLPTLPSIGDTFSIRPGCDKTFGMCGSGKFKDSSGAPASFALHYRGCPFVPQPETLYDGGTGSQTLQSIGTQGTPGAGSPFSGRQGR
jgi:hypothetical protein